MPISKKRHRLAPRYFTSAWWLRMDLTQLDDFVHITGAGDVD
jgi:hypothetical protein